MTAQTASTVGRVGRDDAWLARYAEEGVDHLRPVGETRTIAAFADQGVAAAGGGMNTGEPLSASAAQQPARTDSDAERQDSRCARD